MSKHEQEIVDLVPSEDGVYSPKGTRHNHKKEVKEEQKEKPLPDNVVNFFSGIDMGLQFLEGIDKRISRMLKLKG